jgi:pimeloyl-ACP methyl ester carboxylesterase
MLQQRGYRVVGLRMPGHGTIPSGIRTVTCGDMAAATTMGMKHLGAHCTDQPIHVFGYSTGVALALDYSLHALDDDALPVPATLVLISPVIGVSPLAAVTPWIDRLSRLPGLEQAAWTSLLPEFDPFNYNAFSANAVVQVHRMTRSVTRRIRDRLDDRGTLAGFPRTLVLLSAVDATVSPDAVSDNLLEHLPEGQGALLLYDINRAAAVSPLIVDDPTPKIARLCDHAASPFVYTLVTNEGEARGRVVARTKLSMSPRVDHQEVLDASWPSDAISLSHVDLSFPPHDPPLWPLPAAGRGQGLSGPAVTARRAGRAEPAGASVRTRP